METKIVKIGNKVIGGGNPILIQSMTNTKTENVADTVAQINALTDLGCDIIRCAVPTMEAARALKEIKKQISIPLVADIHFDYKLAIAAIENGADKIRINPGNIGSAERVKAVVDVAKERNIPIRVGVNSGSLEKDLVEKYHGVTAEGLVESALDKVKLIEDIGYDNLVISIKSSDVMMCVKAHELISDKTNHPLHVGITEAGTIISGNIKSAIGLGLILSQGIGDTIRVSLTGSPLEEIKSAKLILRTLGLRKGGIEVVSCPTCGRTQIDLIGLANQVETMVSGYDLDIKVAVMGCVVNGPGEAKEADLGIAGGDGVGLLIRHGEVVKKVPETDLLDTLRQERSQLLKGKSADEAEAAVAKREKELTHALDGARLGVETLHNRLLGLQGEMKQIAATVGELQEQQKKIESPEQLPEIIKQQQEDNLNTERSLSAIEVRLLQQAKNKVTAELIAKELAEKQLIAERWAKLNKLIGSADGAKFKVIAQSYTLNLLLLHANKHLSYLSKRYKLQQVPGTLALQVIDCDMCDEIRTVYSLSGGESFLISLALALGLSSLSSNNLKVESLFIDEGFGSLDADSLRTAMEALEQLQMQGRKIGVISHVQEMSERISVQVQVHKKVNGKSVLTVVG